MSALRKTDLPSAEDFERELLAFQEATKDWHRWEHRMMLCLCLGMTGAFGAIVTSHLSIPVGIGCLALSAVGLVSAILIQWLKLRRQVA